MPRAIDHLVIPARDLSAQAELYRRLGFQVGPRNRHPWGTENHIVQFDGAFLELIGLGADFAPPAPRAGVFSFAAFVAESLARREGLAMLVLRSTDAQADRARFAAAGLGDFENFDFARKARKPDGREVDVAFSLAFTQSAALPDAGFFVCQQHYPENFWSREAQRHPNGAVGLAGLVVQHARPAEAAPFLAGFIDAPAAQISGGFAFQSERATIELLTPAAAVERFGANAIAADAAMPAMRVAVADLGGLGRRLTSNGIEHEARDKALVVPARAAMGVAIVFEAG